MPSVLCRLTESIKKKKNLVLSKCLSDTFVLFNLPVGFSMVCQEICWILMATTVACVSVKSRPVFVKHIEI